MCPWLSSVAARQRASGPLAMTRSAASRRVRRSALPAGRPPARVVQAGAVLHHGVPRAQAQLGRDLGVRPPVAEADGAVERPVLQALQALGQRLQGRAPAVDADPHRVLGRHLVRDVRGLGHAGPDAPLRRAQVAAGEEEAPPGRRAQLQALLEAPVAHRPGHLGRVVAQARPAGGHFLGALEVAPGGGHRGRAGRGVPRGARPRPRRGAAGQPGQGAQGSQGQDLLPAQRSAGCAADRGHGAKHTPPRQIPASVFLSQVGERRDSLWGTPPLATLAAPLRPQPLFERRS